MPQSVSIVLVSNRGPVSYVERDGGFGLKRGAGGLAGALDPVARRLGDDALWIASATSDADRAALDAGEVPRLRDELGYAVELLDVDDATYDRYYNEVSNRMLWFANHCLFDEVGIDDFGDDAVAAWRDAYEPVNERFARAAAERSRPAQFVLFQDYHLARAPLHLRRMRPEQTSFHFTHSSFGGPDCLWRLPAPLPEDVVTGMLGADLLGFHVGAWARNFLACCERVGARVDHERGRVDHDGRSTWVRTYPIPIDPKELRARAGGDAARAWADRLELGDGVLVVRADRSEPTKNVVRGFEAFGALLDRRADLRGHIRFAACLYPSRSGMEEYRRYAADVEAIVERVNGRHPGSVQLFFQDDFDRTVGALMVYDALLVNSICDGMNLVSKEGPVVNRRDGALVLSETAGSFEELGEHAITIADPYDVDATADALERALELPADERARRATALRRAVEATTPDDWIEAQLDDLVALREHGEPSSAPPAP